MLPLLKLAGDGAEHRTRDAVAELARQFNLNEEEISRLTPSGQDFVFGNRWGWARTYLKKAGLIHYTSWGKFQITETGRALLSSEPQKIDLALLKTYPSFLHFYGGAGKSNGLPQTAVDEAAQLVEETPDELIASTHAKLREQVQSELLSRVISCSPAYFEHLVVKLLTTIGYGGSMADAGHAFARSHDGGIDGEIKEDKLGMDMIYIQAKRWQQGAVVGAPEVQKFVGALQGRKARKGVFMTTSNFTKDAIAYAGKVEKNVILVDGTRLAELMFEYGLGVVTVNTYEVKRIESDFFDDGEIG